MNARTQDNENELAFCLFFPSMKIILFNKNILLTQSDIILFGWFSILTNNYVIVTPSVTHFLFITFPMCMFNRGNNGSVLYFLVANLGWTNSPFRKAVKTDLKTHCLT